MAEIAGIDAAASVNRRVAFLYWVRRTHGWFGLWGALFGLLLGTSGVWLNHRAQLKLELPAQKIANAQLPVPDPAPKTAQEMAAWLQQVLKMDRPANTVRVERARPLPWVERSAGERGAGERGGERGRDRAGQPSAERPAGGERPPGERPMQQPERWIVNFGGPNHVVQAEYWVGNRSLSMRTTDNGFIATLTNLHKGVGMPVPWILLVDTIAGSLIFLSLSGAMLWWMTNRRRRLGLAILGVSVTVTVGLALWSLQS